MTTPLPLRKHTAEEIRATRSVPLPTASVTALCGVLGTGGWDAPMVEMSRRYEALLRSHKYLGHWEFHRHIKQPDWIRKSWLYRRVCCLTALYPAMRLYEVVELMARQDREGINDTLMVIAAGSSTDAEKAEYRNEGQCYLTLVLCVEQRLMAQHMAQTCTLPPSEAYATDTTSMSEMQTKIEVKQEMNITNQYAKYISNVETMSGGTINNIETMSGVINSGTFDSVPDAPPAQMPLAFSIDKGMRLWLFLIQEKLVEEDYTPMTNVLYLLGCTDTPPASIKPIHWLGNKQHLREVLMKAYARCFRNPQTNPAGIEKKYLAEELTPKCFVDKQYRPIQLANNSPQPSQVSDHIEDFFKTNW